MVPGIGRGWHLDSLLPPVNLGPVNVYLKLFVVPNGASDTTVDDPKEGDQDCCFISMCLTYY